MRVTFCLIDVQTDQRAEGFPPRRGWLICNPPKQQRRRRKNVVWLVSDRSRISAVVEGTRLSVGESDTVTSCVHGRSNLPRSNWNRRDRQRIDLNAFSEIFRNKSEFYRPAAAMLNFVYRYYICVYTFGTLLKSTIKLY